MCSHWNRAVQKSKIVDLQNFREAEAAPESLAAPEAEYLPPGTGLLFGQYTIAGYLNCGGFGITYLALDSLKRKVAVKECFPSELCYRLGNEMRPQKPAYKSEVDSIVTHFIKEAQRLASLKHDNIVHVHQIFEENATAYMVMDYIDGPDLLDIADGHAPVPAPSEIEEMTVKLLRAIAFVHGRGVLHRDISPDNILVGPGCEPILIDFGSAQQVSDRSPRRPSRLRSVKDGYSPQEFYIPGREQGTWSDLYSLAASLHHVIVGSAPEDGQTRLAEIAANEPDPYKPLAGRIAHFSPRFLKAIDKALQVLPQNRIQTAEDWLTYIGAPVEDPAKVAEREASKPQRSALLSMPVESVAAAVSGPKGKAGAVLAGLVAVAVGVAAFLVLGTGGEDAPLPETVVVAPEPVEQAAPVAAETVVEEAQEQPLPWEVAKPETAAEDDPPVNAGP